MPKLKNDKWERFCKELLKHEFNQTKAYMAAYPDSSKEAACSSASDLLRNPNVARRLSELSTKQEEKDLITVDEIINDLKEVKNRCMQKEPILDKDGKETGEWNFEHTGANKSLELLGKYRGIWKDKLEVSEKEKTAEQLIDEAE